MFSCVKMHSLYVMGSILEVNCKMVKVNWVEKHGLKKQVCETMNQVFICNISAFKTCAKY